MGRTARRTMLIGFILFTIVAVAPLIDNANASEPPASPSPPTLQSPPAKATPLSISDITQLTQTIVLVVTLLLLICQIRATSRVNRMAQYLNALQMMSSVRSEIMSNPSLIDPEQESSFFREMYALVGEEGYYYKLKLLHTFELFFLLHKFKLIEDEMWLGWRNNISICFEADINRRVWIAIRDKALFHPHFTAFVDGLIPPDAKMDQQEGTTPSPHAKKLTVDRQRRIPRFVAGDTALAAIGEKDWIYFHRWLNSEHMVKSMRDLDAYPIGEEDAKRYVASHRKDTWLILAREGTGWAPIGYASLVIRHRHRIGRLFLAIGEPEYLGRGHGRSTCAMIVRWSFQDCNLEAIHLSVSANNPRAIKLYSDQGFRECGRYLKARFENGQRYDEILMELTREMLDRRDREAQA